MNRVRLAGIGLIAVGVVGYVVGVSVAYAGRAFSLTAVMIGITLVAIAPRTAARAEP
ncbi:hypothetical protein C488_10413 [Natrinema pellirubrum DSM 15624]|uniref:Uncharacterized protein n=1 Tax=Natrinema pellirubrum (strain DSM 15624 / CIP 106293 / JCM 10476 / NCIMB 786 / 157) TaxID=797303 RepID=L0JJY1_NATP1|nr:hypothetical protein [Natrinema pellirubrum]AGB30666.1 hypothetical protein Natpe_0745 [Natrinema pellirubrum DSM 15624]ELY74858.1 hypothetical protein C488_10413 [Natrinema pellirubrum DSM 15624]